MAKARIDDELEVLERANNAAEAMHGPTLYSQLWTLLDRMVDELMKAPSDLTKGRAQGVAECIVIFGKPLVNDVDEVRAKAMERWEARQKKTTTKKATTKRRRVTR